MSYFDDIAFTYFGALAPYAHAVRTRVQPSWFWSLEYCRRGSFTFAKNTEESVTLTPPVVFWLSPGNYYIYGTQTREGRTHAWTNCTGARAERMIGSLDRMWPRGYVELMPEDEAQFTPVYSRMQDYISTRSRKDHPRAVLCMEELLAQLTAIHFREHGQPLIDMKMEALIKKIRFSPFSDYDFKTIAAEEFHMSYSGFRKFFKRVNRIAPHEFVMTQRIYHAMELLRNHRLQIQEVAMQCGFNDFSSFSRLFRQKTGYSPSRYRKEWLEPGGRDSALRQTKAGAGTPPYPFGG